VVIVVALFIVALVATMSYVMMERLARDTRRTELILRNNQAELYAGGSVIWAKDYLRNDWIKQKKDKRVDELPIKSPVNEVNGYSISSTITDAQGRFNINNVAKPEWQASFIRLINLVDPNVSQGDASAIALATVDWVTPGARDNEFTRYYAELPVPYRPAHALMVDPGELRLVKGITPKLFAALKPYITALPEALDVIKNHHIQESQATLTSNYFLVSTEVGIEHQRILLYTLLQRLPGSGKADVLILWQNRGAE
jgi:general secretion pathway protein K